MFPDGTSLTKARFVDMVETALEEVGLPWEQFSSHSFRIGAATTAALAGLEDSMITLLGHGTVQRSFGTLGHRGRV